MFRLVMNGRPPCVGRAVNVRRGVVDEEGCFWVQAKLALNFLVGFQIGLSVAQTVAVNDLSEGLLEGFALLVKDLLFEMCSVQGICVAEQDEIELISQPVEQGEEIRPQSNEHGIPGLGHLIDSGVWVAPVLECQNELILGGPTTF